jgi:hypothetical protein
VPAFVAPRPPSSLPRVARAIEVPA